MAPGWLVTKMAPILGSHTVGAISRRASPPDPLTSSDLLFLAERVGFEPTVSFPTHDFQSCRFGRSRTPPACRQASLAMPARLEQAAAWYRARRSGSAQRGAANRVRA
jgi:hypothetical protein